MTIHWTTDAVKGLQGLTGFYQQINGEAADYLHNEIRRCIHRLSLEPFTGAIEPNLTAYTDTFRSIVLDDLFRLVYRVDVTLNEITVVAAARCDYPDEVMNYKIGEFIRSFIPEDN
jgi:plasmid stabilization system protein ParE